MENSKCVITSGIFQSALDKVASFSLCQGWLNTFGESMMED